MDAAVSNRHPQRAIDVHKYAGLDGVVVAETQGQLDEAIHAGKNVATGDALLLARSDLIDVILEVTGAVDFGAHVILEAFKHGKDVVLMNAEIDATIGPILQVYAKKYGVILSACEGDEPGIQMNLYRWVRGLGLIPRVIGNVKGLQDRYRNPTTQKAYAEKWGQNPAMVTSFADGSKTNFEQTIVANATGFKVKSRGMSRGLDYRGDIMQIGKLYDIDELREASGIVDYVVGRHSRKSSCLPSTPIRSNVSISTCTIWVKDRSIRSLYHTIFRISKCRTRSRVSPCSAIAWPRRLAAQLSRCAQSPSET